MKKLFLLLTFITLIVVACSDDNVSDNNPPGWLGDWNDKNDPNYVADGYNPIEGQWFVTIFNNVIVKDTTVYQFDDSFLWKTAKSITEKQDQNGNTIRLPQYDSFASSYRINSTQILSLGYMTTYKLTPDKQYLTLNDGSNKTEFIRLN